MCTMTGVMSTDIRIVDGVIYKEIHLISHEVTYIACSF